MSGWVSDEYRERWTELRRRLFAKHIFDEWYGYVCEDCGGLGNVHLRRITQVNGDYPEEDDVRFLCLPCYNWRRPIPYSVEDQRLRRIFE